jgi:hypothetical protein
VALTVVTVHGQILQPVTNVPAVGTVQFNTLIELRDVVDNIVYTPMTFTATLDVNGEFTIVLPATDNPDLIPVNWVYQVWIDTDALNTTQYFQLPFSVGVTEFADLEPLDFDPCTDQIPASTPIAPSDYDLFVRKTGDTMSGNLVINANLQVNGTAGVTYGNTSLDIGQLLAMSMSTCVLSGGELIPNADPTRIDITAMTGVIIDWDSVAPISPTNPNLTYVTWPGVVGLVPTFAPITWYLIDSTGSLVQQALQPTPAQRRQNVVLGLTLTQGGIILVDQSLPTIPSQLNNQLADLMDSLGPFIDAGGVLSPNGVNLSMNLNTSDTFTRAFSQVPDYEDPHNAIISAQTPVQFRHITRLTGSAGPLTNLLNVGFYDNAGVVTPVGGGANASTNFRVWGFANNTVTEQILVQYGQNTYASLAAAVNGLGAGNYIPQPATSLGALIGWISVIRTATNLSDPTQCVFTKAPKFPIP